jgi:hypothetical protein
MFPLSFQSFQKSAAQVEDLLQSGRNQKAKFKLSPVRLMQDITKTG